MNHETLLNYILNDMAKFKEQTGQPIKEIVVGKIQWRLIVLTFGENCRVSDPFARDNYIFGVPIKEGNFMYGMIIN